MSIYPYLGTNVDPSHISEIHYRGLLEEGETLLALFDGVLIDERGRRIGGVSLTDFVVLTDQRLITWARGFFNDSVDGFPWKDVDVVESKTWDPLHGRVILAFRLIPVTPRQRRIAIKGMRPTNPSSGDQAERIIINTLDYMPAGDIPVLTDMVGWIGDQVVAGVSGDELLAAFADTFPLPDADPVVPPEMLDATADPSSSFQSKEDAQKRSWWSFGNKDGRQEEDLVDSPDKLIAAYEVQRSGETTSPLSQQSLFPTRNPGAVPTAFGQFGFYDVSRGMRLLFEGPRRVGTSLNRVNDVLVDTAELIEDLQDPKMRKRTISGLRFAMDMQDQPSGLLGAVAPVVRAVLGSSNQEGGGGGRRESGGEESGDRPSVRRIQVRASVRQREKQRTAEQEAAEDATEETPAPTQRNTENQRPSVRTGESASATGSSSSPTRVRRPIRSRKSTAESGSDNGATDTMAERTPAAPEPINVQKTRVASSAESEPPAEEKE